MELKRIRKELSSEEFTKIYHQLRQEHPVLSPFSTPFSLIDFFRAQTRPPCLSPPATARHERTGESDGGQAKDYATENSILRCLIREYQKGIPYDCLGSFFLALFTPAIAKTYSQAKKKALRADPEELLNQICLSFLQTLKDEKLTRCEEKVASTILGKVKNLMRSWINERLKHEKMRTELPPEHDYTPIIRKGLSDLETAHRFLNLFVEAGIITETDKLLILGTKILKRPLRCFAPRPQDYAKVRKRRYRAIKAMESYLDRKRRTYALKARLNEKEVSAADILKEFLG